ncbi:MAG: glycosyltransferase family 4 protein [Candidatus Moranbacteria bacterium]|nr:glycosyltransferase family 4 protein [Candidatus Moranbacteria bacterium]
MSSKKKTVLIITFSQGGPYVWAQNLAKHLEKRGYAVTVIWGRKAYLKQMFQRYDIVHSCVPVPNLFCKKYILTIHGNFKAEKHLGRFFYPLIIQQADFTTTPSNFLKKTLGIKKILVIPNGVNIPETTKTTYDLDSKNPKLGILTNFNFRKKADGTVKLARIIEAVSPEATLVIGGGGVFFEAYKKTILEIHANTEFLGYCEKEDLFNRIDIFAYYSMLDNQPLAVLEAMAFGLPVISNVVGSIEEILTGQMEGHIARTDEDYQAILKKFITSKEERKRGGAEAIRIAKNFSWTKITGKYIKLYNK